MKSCFKLTLILFTLIIFLTACKKDTTEFQLNEFGCALSFICEDEEYKGDFSFVNKEEMSFTVNQPDDINGCRFTYKNGEITLSFDGVSTGVRETSPVKKLFQILSAFSDKTCKVKSKGTDIISVSDENVKYDVTVDCDRKIIKEINTGEIIYRFS